MRLNQVSPEILLEVLTTNQKLQYDTLIAYFDDNCLLAFCRVFRDVPSDIKIQVSGVTFALHKFPLVSCCGRIRKLVAGHRDSDISRIEIELTSLPGGAQTFELAAKFCYGVNFEITSANVAQLCCVSDYLEMTEEFSKNNLCSRAEEYLDSIVCKSLEMCVEVLRQCENLLPLADELKIVCRCIDAIASKACVEQIASSFSRLEYSSSGRLHMNRQAKCDAKCDGRLVDRRSLCPAY
ncbi:hypothetical protein RHSIM_Rhsim13G0045000 [Rhododendron simsii]|uniref:BTB domain-containing protein n=1 Tax=Rhododendron simsii TaxID=118357 RepID=A0A834FYM8_RHOSS|nr:hypothetical protein RHSIM_Rhsim13G0045000 [Rhododendron simsii]